MALPNPSSNERFDFNRPLWNPVGSQTIGYAEQITELESGKKQSQINKETQGSLTRIEKLAKAALVL